MGYLTATDLAKLEITKSRGAEDRDLLKDEILKDKKSDRKSKMIDGVAYFKAKNTKIVDETNFNVSIVDGEKFVDKNHPNIKIPHAFHRLLVRQKASYIVGKPITFGFKGEEQEDQKETYDKLKADLTDYLGDSFHDFLNKVVTNASNKGVEYIHPYINKRGEFDYMIVNAENIIPLYDAKSGEELVGVINYWDEKFKDVMTGETSTRTKAEVWGENHVSYYVTNEAGEFEMDPDHEINPKGHFQVKDTLTEDVKQEGWGRVPFIEIRNDEDMMTDLEIIKEHIDAYDIIMSDESNDITQIQELIWILKGYRGTSLSEFMMNLKKYKAMKLDKDGSAEPKSADLPHETRGVHLKRLEDNIFLFGMGVNVNPDKIGDAPSGVALELMYTLLDQKANITIRKMKPALREFLWFLMTFMEGESGERRISFNYEDVTFTFNKTMLTNDTEIIKNLNESNISEQTYWELHPYIDDAGEEERRVEAQRDAQPGFSLVETDEDPTEEEDDE